MSQVTQILDAIESGDAHATDQLLPLVYAELRRLAAAKLAHEKLGQTLDATGLGLALIGSPDGSISFTGTGADQDNAGDGGIYFNGTATNVDGSSPGLGPRSCPGS